MKTINTFVFFLNESFLGIKTNIWRAPCTRKSNFTSRAFFLLLLFFFLYFPILFFSTKLTLTENSSSPIFFAFLPFFRSVFTRCRVFLLLQRHGERTIIMISGFTGSYEHSNRICFFSITKCTGKARHSSKVLNRKLRQVYFVSVVRFRSDCFVTNDLNILCRKGCSPWNW